MMTFADDQPPAREPVVTRSVLFGAATRDGFVGKALSVGADLAVLDLEDAVPEGAKAAARQYLADQRPGAVERGRLRLLVRTNGVRTTHFAADVAAAAAAGVDGIVVPVLGSADDVHFARGALAMTTLAGGMVVGGIETIRGLQRVAEICRAGLDLVYFGAEDFVTDLGGVRTVDNSEVAVARAQIVWAARSAGIAALDVVVADFTDLDRFVREANEARALGYGGKLCIHPAQVAPANDAFSPTPAEVDSARQIIAAAASAAAEGLGAIGVGGVMIDEPIIERARAVLARSALLEPKP